MEMVFQVHWIIFGVQRNCVESMEEIPPLEELPNLNIHLIIPLVANFKLNLALRNNFNSC